jgi:hypothetical protein
MKFQLEDMKEFEDLNDESSLKLLSLNQTLEDLHENFIMI